MSFASAQSRGSRPFKPPHGASQRFDGVCATDRGDTPPLPCTGNGSGVDEHTLLVALRVAMWVHAFLDAAGAIALFFTPHIVSVLAPALCAEPYALRIVAGALTAIAYASARAASYERVRHFAPLLQLKVVWSTTVWLGLAWSITELSTTAAGVPLVAWLTLATFVTGSVIWWTFTLLLATLALQTRRRRAYEAQMRARGVR